MKTITFPKLNPLLVMLVFFLPLLSAASPQSAKTKTVKLSHKQLLWLIGHAETPAEHEELATYYHQQALHLLREVKDHQEMAQTYLTSAKHLSIPPNLVAQHCSDWADLYSKQTKDAEALAALHEQMAKKAAEKKP